MFFMSEAIFPSNFVTVQRSSSSSASGAFFVKRVEGFHHSALRLIPCQRHPFGTKSAGFAQCDEIMMTLSNYQIFKIASAKNAPQ